MGRNLEAFERYAALLGEGRVTAIFPEGLTQDAPQLSRVKTGAARIAFQAEAAADFTLQLTVVPVGLQYEPRRRFRADAFVRFGDGFTITDLASRYTEDSQQAVRELTDRIGAALKRVAYHVDSAEQIPLIERLADVYRRRAGGTGIAGVLGWGLRGELLQQMAACLNHFTGTDPASVAQVTRALDRYERLREKAGIDRRLLEDPAHLLPGPLALVQATAEAILGLVPALFGFLTGAIPYFAAKRLADLASARDGNVASLSFRHILSGAVTFPLVYALETAWVWQGSNGATVVTVAFGVLLIPTGLFTLAYARRMRTLVAHLGDRTASWFKLGAIARVRKAQDELVQTLDGLRNRYRQEVLGWDPLPAGFTRRGTWAVLTGVLVIGIATTATLLVLFVSAYQDLDIQGLPTGPSPWQAMRLSDPAEAERELRRDARGTILAARQLDRMQEQMAVLRAEFLRGDRNFLTQEDHDATRALLLPYLDLRSALLKTVWRYRGENTEAALTTDDPLGARAFLTGYAAAALLAEKAWLIYDTFQHEPVTRQQLDLGDLAWGIPPGVFSTIDNTFSNAAEMANLQRATRRFEADRQAGHVPLEAPWSDLANRAERARPALDAIFDDIRRRKLRRAFREVGRQIRLPVDAITPAVSMAISRVRLRERPPHQGLISQEQLQELKAELQPGDILIERRNWFVSNSLLPGFWPHAALYLGSHEELVALGVAMDPQTASHLSDLQGQDELRNDFAVLEAIGEGVISILSAAFAALATLLAAIGLYGVLAYTVAQRTREIGLRMALGADGGRVRGMVMRQVGRMTLIGGAVGLTLAIGLGRLAGSLLFELESADPLVMIVAVVALSLVALGAGAIPAWRASRIEPMRALHYE